MVNDRGTLYARRGGCDSDVGGSGDRYNRGYSDTVLHGNLYRLQAPVCVKNRGPFQTDER